jgi:NAD+ kinase
MIVFDDRNPVAIAHAHALTAAIGERRLPDLVVVIGGDGFLLHTIAERGVTRPFVGLNAGRVGFLLNDVGDWGEVADALVQGLIHVCVFPMLSAIVTAPDGSQVEATAVNDVYLERASGQTARIGLRVDGSLVVDELVSDGVIVSTALGSTAYNFSAGGPACHPALQTLTVTPICPHLPRLPSLTLPKTSVVEIEVLHVDRRPVRAVADGRDIGKARHVRIACAPQTLSLGFLPGHDFTARLIQKILHP